MHPDVPKSADKCSRSFCLPLFVPSKRECFAVCVCFRLQRGCHSYTQVTVTATVVGGGGGKKEGREEARRTNDTRVFCEQLSFRFADYNNTPGQQEE